MTALERVEGRYEPLPTDVEVWHVRLDVSEAQLARDRELLGPTERARADRFLFDKHRHRWTACRAALRRLLADRTGQSPDQLAFEKGEHGKPYLLPKTPTGLQFNISHSDVHALVAMSFGAELGVDLERVNPSRDIDAIAERFFSPLEAQRYFRVDPAEERLKTFFRLWSCKEAYIKALGLGLAAGLHNFDILLAPDTPARLGATRPDEAQAAHWHLLELAGPEGYESALVVPSSTSVATG